MTAIPGPVVVRVLVALEEAVHLLVRSIDRPLYIGVPGRGYIRYSVRNSQVMQVLKAVRVVSGLRAALHLIRVGHLQEAAVVLRSVHDALQDIQVLDEAHFSETAAKEYQKRLVNEFFQDDFERLASTVKGEDQAISRVPRRKKLAAIDRQLSQAGDGSSLRPELDGVALVLDGYTHGGYGQIMELYSASERAEGFHMHGVFEPGRVQSFVHWTAQFAHPALNRMAQLLRDTRHPDEAMKLIALRKDLEASDEYPS